MTDKELLKKLKKDKASGLSVVIDLYSGLLYKLASAIILPVGTKEDVEECLSDSFYAFYEQLESIDLKKASIRSFLAVITRRKAIDFYRRLSRKSDCCLEAVDEAQVAEKDFTLSLERRRLILSALKELGEPDTTIVTRKYLFNETAAEIADSLQMSQEAVQKRLERARDKLKLMLGGVYCE